MSLLLSIVGVFQGLTTLAPSVDDQTPVSIEVAHMFAEMH